MNICDMCGGEFADGLDVCPICGTKKEISFSAEPYVTKIEQKKTEKEYYDSVDMRKYKNQVQVGLIVIYALSLISIFTYLSIGYTLGTAIGSVIIFVIPTLIVQFTRSRIAAVIVVILACLNFILSGFSMAGIAMAVSSIVMAKGIFQFKDKWDFYLHK